MDSTPIDIPLSIGLLNRLRTFEHNAHTFNQTFLEEVDLLLSQVQKRLKAAPDVGQYPFETIYLLMHYYFSLIYNLETFISQFKDTLEVVPLNFANINSTNIFNIHSLIKALHAKRASQSLDTSIQSTQDASVVTEASESTQDEKESAKDVHFLQRFKVQLNSKETKANSSNLFLSFDLVDIAFTSRGRYDLDFISIICSELNKAFDLELYPHVLHQIDGNEILTNDYSKTAHSILKSTKENTFQQDDFDSYVKVFSETKSTKKFANALSDLEDTIFYAQFKRDKPSLDLLERLLICLLGHKDVSVRDQAVILLNILYDGIDWQLKGAYRGRVSTVGNEFKMEQLLEDEPDEYSIGFLLYAYSFDGNNEDPILSWHKPEVYPFKDEEGQVSSHVVASVDFGNFPRAGFYDWKFVKFLKGGKVSSLYTGNVKAVEDRSSDNLSSSFLTQAANVKQESIETKAIHGRYIVHPKITKDLQIHEVFAENPEGIPGPIYRGSFHRIKETLPSFAKQGINCVYLMGALESDYKVEKDPVTKQEVINKKPGSNPMAVTDRTSVSTYLGGSNEFNDLMTVAKDKKIKIVLDYVARISSSRPNKRYRDLLVHTVDSEGRYLPAFGGEGRSVNYEDTIYLNYRKKEAWDLLIEEAVELCSKYRIDGLHLDDAQCWPNILEADIQELERKDTDGSPAYTPEDVFYGNIVAPRTFSGYWNTESKGSYPSPMLIRFCKTLWQRFPELLLIGEAWGGQGYEDREFQLIKSGVIPRLFKIPPAMTAVYGQYLHRDGRLSNCEVLSVNSLRSWYESFRRKLPTGSIIIQSTTDNCWPSPAFLFKRGAWSFVDLMFFLPDIPITFMGEILGHAYRCPTVKRIQTQLEKPARSKVSSRESRENLLKDIFESVANYLEPGQIKVGSCICEKHDTTDFWNSQGGFNQDIGPQFGFDLNKIGLHYEHRRQIRQKLEVLRTGKLVSLLAEHQEGLHSHVLSFARVAKNEMAIIATNFNEFNVYFSINLKNLKFLFDELGQEALEHCVIKIQDQIGNAFDEYYTVYEFLYGRIDTSLKPHSSLIWAATITTGDLELYKQTLIRSMDRIKAKIARNQVIEGNEVTAMITNVVRDVNSLQLFANNMGYILRRFLQPYDVPIVQIFNSIKQFRDDPSICAKLFAFCHLLSERAALTTQKAPAIEAAAEDEKEPKRKGSSLYVSKTTDEQGNVVYKTEEQNKEGYSEGFDIRRVYDFAKEVINFNKLGPIAFITPELGRWSTTGGLGVMVDELSICLAQLGEEVICISPYYERNRKGETGYLEKDPDNIKHIFNMEVYLGDGKYVVGVHSGKVKGVTQYFLHNPFIFPHPYADGDARFTMQQLSLMAKASLEVFCVLQRVPSLVVTNDWFTALVAAYPKHNHFGEVFKGTKFLHIVHNLDPTYEGRLYPNPHEGLLGYIHKLPDYLFFDEHWKDRVINPSRCAILSSDQWATVSPSYRNELLSTSPLASILKNHPQPFAFPNGIPREARLQRIVSICGNDHLKAKEALQKKYFKMTALDDSIGLFAFVGRITQQKGVHLILESAEHLMREYGSKIQFLLGGMVNMKDPYGSYCAGMMYDLTHRYPNNFWSSPTEFFTDGALVNTGADYGLMPSLFEPGGIVQHEFFIGSTPVIAFSTGGLKDSVFEFDPKLEKGNGFVFYSHKSGDLIYAIQRAMSVFKDKPKYQKLRSNAFESTIDVDDVARAWNKEFHRLFNKTFMDPVIMKTHLEIIDKKFDENAYEEKFTLRKVVAEVSPELQKANKIRSHNYYLKARKNLRSCVFTYKTDKLPRPKSVKLVGSYDNWAEETTMNYDHIMGRWNVTIQLPSGEYFYKFVVDDKFVCSDDDPKLNDLQGNINNYIQVL